MPEMIKWPSLRNVYLYEEKTKFFQIFCHDSLLILSVFWSSVVLNFELLHACSFPLGKVRVHARLKLEIVIFCALMLARSLNQSQVHGNTC